MPSRHHDSHVAGALGDHQTCVFLPLSARRNDVNRCAHRGSPAGALGVPRTCNNCHAPDGHEYSSQVHETPSMHAAKTVHNSSVCAEPDMQCLAVHRAALVGMAHSGVTPPSVGTDAPHASMRTKTNHHTWLEKAGARLGSPQRGEAWGARPWQNNYKTEFFAGHRFRTAGLRACSAYCTAGVRVQLCGQDAYRKAVRLA